MCTLERHSTKSKILQQPVAITGLQLLTKHDGASAGLAGQVVLQGPGKPAGRVLLNRGGNFQEQSAAKLHLPHQVHGEEAVGDVGESYIGGIATSFRNFSLFRSLCQLNPPPPQKRPPTLHNQGSLLSRQGYNQGQLTSSRLHSETRASLNQRLGEKSFQSNPLVDGVLVPQH